MKLGNRQQAIAWDRRRQVMKLIRDGLTSSEIAEALNIDIRMVASDEKAVRKLNIAAAMEADQEILDRTVDRMLQLYRKELESFERSLQDEVRVEITEQETKDGTFMTRREIRTPQAGDPRFLAEARQALMEMAKLQGLTGNNKDEGAGKSGVPQLMRIVVANGNAGRLQIKHMESLTFDQAREENIIEGEMVETPEELKAADDELVDEDSDADFVDDPTKIAGEPEEDEGDEEAEG
jgi:hypothetical protein